MTKAQYKVYNRLARKQVNRATDILVVEATDNAVCFYMSFPGLYLTFGRDGRLLSTETTTERVVRKEPLARPGDPQQMLFHQAIGEDDYQHRSAEKTPPIVPDDDDVPF